MAKWGEGDPRWIVEERPDATNVNNWHWTEKNACQWSKDKIKNLFTNFKIDGKSLQVEITEVEKCDGEAVANNRKGKLIFFYEWDITLNWKAHISGVEKEIEGKVAIPNLSEENSVEEIEVNTSLKEPSKEGEVVKDFMYQEGRSKIREQLAAYISSLKEEFSQGMILPKKEESCNKGKSVTSINNAKTLMNNVIESKKIDTSKVATSTLNFSQTFICTGDEFYNALTTPQMVSAFTHSPAVLDNREGGKFEMFNGNIYGEFIKLVPGKKIVQRWRSKRWPDGHFSTVTLDIEQQKDHTLVKVSQTGIPESEYDSTKENWDRYYWESMKRYLGFGTFL
ncbi:unnamed protein product [Bemisia tabaci]|uniref:Activator of Hsp90 ATPase AHSA1-like N-terminal domain-containing protein n=1 Tax=Bemisia tabaci TaxID=7038 RepID=A0A9P0A0Z2_BEMTA|nr:PREDICTED: activator of 90 kDa heat shock protein ATPase homolog 1 [Bemisia tabaci]XP_018899184.1 PREDICTED: activator of 90 kDa heat shock protein ATPase homolog 1 [Bemisia tabaci]CAH0383977.1 unnamed protein product [Bemisia tabaci]